MESKSGFCECQEECSDFFQVLSDKTRQDIIMLFSTKKEVGVTEIAAEFTLSRPTISHHLNLMKRAKFLKSRKDGKEVYYSLNKEFIINLLESILKSLRTCC
ncbi:MAG: winged helix-turn-helix transcriptional regulator [Spirochaetales bacterium]|nr:winged helix-turn-helix transcriptional regulator [Spirochaetales bacterium]